jgi:hypothetical protein
VLLLLFIASGNIIAFVRYVFKGCGSVDGDIQVVGFANSSSGKFIHFF